MKWKSTLIMAVAGIGPVIVAIVTLYQFDIIGLAAALLLGFLYLVFVSSHVWCRIFTKIPPSSPQEQVDALPCYEDAVKSDLPSYYTLFRERPASCDVKHSSGVTSSSIGSKPVDFAFSSEPDSKTDIIPVFRISQKHQNKVLAPSSPTSFNGKLVFPTACSDAEPAPPPEVEERRMKKEKVYANIVEAIANPVNLCNY
ncbi:uncharacterized protein LOC135209697 [Macrobrachium nipponense]|uniref:uncharacterized protein LOC135209697 n=1 Tax=Macrobrachium nipponense TaxID=159736 RepID=UPI0030C8791B